MEWASPWDNSNSATSKKTNENMENTKKRTPTMNLPTNSYKESMSVPSSNKPSNEYTNVKPYLETNPNVEKIDQENLENPITMGSMESTKIINEQRNSKINKLI